VGDAVELRFDGLVHLNIAMTQAIDGGAARAVDIAFAIGVIDVNTFAPGDFGQFDGGDINGVDSLRHGQGV
jgi:hypothetical protein